MGYIALYRKFRPQNYDEVKGQDHIVKALRNQVKHDVVSHAYLFHGTRGNRQDHDGQDLFEGD